MERTESIDGLLDPQGVLIRQDVRMAGGCRGTLKEGR